MARPISSSELEAYLDEALPSADMARIEKCLRKDPTLVERLAAINTRRDMGVHSLGEIWRRNRLSCPTRSQLGSYLLETLDPDDSEHVTFHLETIGCRYCRANVSDLKQHQAENATVAETRRRKYFQSSAGYLRRS